MVKRAMGSGRLAALGKRHSYQGQRDFSVLRVRLVVSSIEKCRWRTNSTFLDSPDPDVRDLVDVHGSGRECRNGLHRRAPFDGSNS
jgi:hypothetical protein